MLRRLTVSNFRSLGDEVTVDFDCLTALVGPNGSGKSNLIDALSFVSDSMRMGLSGAITHRHGIQAVRRWSAGHPFNVAIKLELTLPKGHGTYSFELRGDSAEEYSVKTEQAEVLASDQRFRFRVEGGRWLEGPAGLQPQLDRQTLGLPLVGGDSRFQPLLQALTGISVYTIYPDTLRVPQKYDPTKPMDRHGSNWASILKDQPRDTWKSELILALRKLTGDIEDMKVVPAASYLLVQFRHSSQTRARKWFDATQESDGTLRVAGIVSALLQEPSVPVVCVEEPELTVHPGAIPLLYDYLIQATRTSQIVMSTHSPELLDRLSADEVFVVSRDNGATSVARMAEDRREAVRSGLLGLGDMLRLDDLQPELPFGVSSRPS